MVSDISTDETEESITPAFPRLHVPMQAADWGIWSAAILWSYSLQFYCRIAAHCWPIPPWTTAFFCLCWLSLCADLVSPNKTEVHIKLYVSFGADICFVGECRKSEGTDIPLELEKWGGPMFYVCLSDTFRSRGFTFRGCWWLYNTYRTGFTVGVDGKEWSW